MSKKYDKVRSLNNVKHDGEWHLPGTTWQCPTTDIQALIDSGAIERCGELAVPASETPPPPLADISIMKKAAIIAELKRRDLTFLPTEPIEELREVLSMAWETQDK